MKLTAENVQNLLDDCLFPDPKPSGEGKTAVQVNEELEKYRADCVAKGKIVTGIVRSFCFRHEQLDKHREEIVDLLEQLPEQFKAASGGGWSFLNACIDMEGNQWGEHRDVEALLCLGMGIGYVQEIMSTMRRVLPGGMPYYVIGFPPVAPAVV